MKNQDREVSALWEVMHRCQTNAPFTRNYTPFTEETLVKTRFLPSYSSDRSTLFTSEACIRFIFIHIEPNLIPEKTVTLQ